MSKIRRCLLAFASLALFATAGCSADSISGPEPTEAHENQGLMGSGG